MINKKYRRLILENDQSASTNPEKGAFLDFNLIPDNFKQKVYAKIKQAGIGLLKTSKRGLAKIASKTNTDIAQLTIDTGIVAGILSGLGINSQSLTIVGLFATSKYLPKTNFFKTMSAYLDYMDNAEDIDKKYPVDDSKYNSDYDRVQQYRLDKEARRAKLAAQKNAQEQSLKESRMLRLQRKTKRLPNYNR